MSSIETGNKKSWRVLGCLVKAPLGCLSFLLGAGVVLVVFFPAASGRVFSNWLGDAFAETYAGSLETEGAWLGSLYGPQSIDRFVLRDPDRKEILHGELHAPSFGPVVLSEAPWGPIVVRIPMVVLQEDADGVTNLARAFRPAEATSDGSERSGASPFEEHVELDALTIDVGIERIDWTGRGGEALRLSRLRCTVEVTSGAEGVAVSLEGRAQIGERTDTEPLRFAWSIDDVCTAHDESSPWTFTLDGEHVPATLPRALFPELATLENALGSHATRLRIALSGDEAGNRRVDAFVAESDRLHVELEGRWPMGGTIHAADGDVAIFRFPEENEVARHRVVELLPFAGDVVPTSDDRWTTVWLEHFQLPMDGDVENAHGVVHLDGDELQFEVADPLRERLQLAERMRVPSLLRLANGVATFENDAVPQPGSLGLSGTYELRTRGYALRVTLPDHSTFTVFGPRGAPEIEPMSDH